MRLKRPNKRKPTRKEKMAGEANKPLPAERKQLRHAFELYQSAGRKAAKIKIQNEKDAANRILRRWRAILAKLSQNRERKTWAPYLHAAERNYQYHTAELAHLENHLILLHMQKDFAERTGDTKSSHECAQKIEQNIKTYRQVLDDIEILLKEVRNQLP